jgi:hypothetical protein
MFVKLHIAPQNEQSYLPGPAKAVRLEGVEPATNSNALSRDIVLHSADYVSLGYKVPGENGRNTKTRKNPGFWRF